MWVSRSGLASMHIDSNGRRTSDRKTETIGHKSIHWPSEKTVAPLRMFVFAREPHLKVQVVSSKSTSSFTSSELVFQFAELAHGSEFTRDRESDGENAARPRDSI